MIDKPDVDYVILAPVFALIAASTLALLGAVLVPHRARAAFGAIVCGLGFAGAFVAAALLYVYSEEARSVIADSVQRDRLAGLAAMIVAGSGLLATGVSWSNRRNA